MSQYVRYEIENGIDVFVEIVENQNGVVRAGISEDIQNARTSFEKALDGVRATAVKLKDKLNGLEFDEVEVKFGIKAIGDVGNNVFAIAKLGIESNFEVTIKWKGNR